MWITISSGILGFSFIFGNSIRTVFESCLTLFVVHPFDVGDTIFIEGGYHVVEEASLNKVDLCNTTNFTALKLSQDSLRGSYHVAQEALLNKVQMPKP